MYAFRTMAARPRRRVAPPYVERQRLGPWRERLALRDVLVEEPTIEEVIRAYYTNKRAV